MPCSGIEACAAGLDGLDLSLRPCKALEALGQLGAVKEGALAGFDGAERSSGCRTDAARRELVCLVQRAVLLRLLSVAGKGLGQRVSGRSRVSLRSVVNLCGKSALRAIEA